jgi:hypothetical protein
MAAEAAVIAGAVAMAGCASEQRPQSQGAQSPISQSQARQSRDPQSQGPQVPSATVYQSPEQATLSWFYAINHKDKADAIAHFTRTAATQMDWGGGNASTWPTFSALQGPLGAEPLGQVPGRQRGHPVGRGQEPAGDRPQSVRNPLMNVSPP